jgi:hypothetical protein
MNITTIKDAVKALAQSLQVTTVFPAALMVLVNAYVVVHQIWPSIGLATPSAVTIMVSLTLMLSYTFYAFNFPLIRFLEGYKVQDSDIFRGALKRQREQFRDLDVRIRMLREQDQAYRSLFEELDWDALAQEEMIDVRWKEWQEVRLDRARFEHEFDRDFPSQIGMVLPTRLGNTIAAFEDYPRTRYGMDPIVLWGRLVPLLKEKQFLEFVSQEKSVFDFLLNTCIVVAFLGLELFYLCLFLGEFVLAVLVLGLAGLFVWVLYNGMVIAARQWGTTVRVAFDLHRHDLCQHLGLRPAKSFRKEVERWQAISRFFLYRQDDIDRGFREFIPQAEVAKQEKQTAK